MKKILLIVLLLIVGCSITETDYYPNGQMKYQRETIGMISGTGRMEHGKAVKWYENGQKKEDGNYTSDGNYSSRKTGLWTFWHENGQKQASGYYSEYENLTMVGYVGGKPTGLWTFWHDNGNKKKEGNYKSKEEIGDWIYWDENGKKIGVGSYKESPFSIYFTTNKWNGIFVEDDSGLPSFSPLPKVIFVLKDSKLVSAECWDEDGNECECKENVHEHYIYGACKGSHLPLW